MSIPPHASKAVVLLLAVGVASAGCDAEAADPGWVVRDSAGITIVENDHTRPAWAGAAGWRLSEAPVTQIGMVDGPPEQQLYRVVHSRRLRDGTIAVVNSGTSEVKLYDARGQHVRTIGRDGDGPGEFRSPWKIHELPGDSLLVIDLYREISVFGPDHRYVRRFATVLPDSAIGHGLEPVDQFGDGTLLFRRHLPERDPTFVGVRRNRIDMMRYGLDGRSLGSLGEFDDQTGSLNTGIGRYMFGAWAKEAATDSSMWYGPGDVFEIREIAFDGRVLRLVRLDAPLRPVTEQDQEDYKAASIERVRGTREEQIMERMIVGSIFPAHFPAHYELMVDDAGNLWVQDYQPFGAEIPRMWSVFDRRGRYLGPVEVPAGFTVHHIGDRFVTGRWTDEMDVEYVRVYAIEKRG